MTCVLAKADDVKESDNAAAEGEAYVTANQRAAPRGGARFTQSAAVSRRFPA